MSIYCTYLTIYRGNQLPPFYIGFSTIKKVERGYHGSASSKRYKKIWKQELRARPELFVTRILTIHDTQEEAVARELKFQRRLKVTMNPLYINMSAFPQINTKGYSNAVRKKLGLKPLPGPGKGLIHSIESRMERSRRLKGVKKPYLRRPPGIPNSKEARKNASIGAINRSKYVCPDCGQIIDSSNFKRHLGSAKCRLRSRQSSSLFIC